MAVRNYEEEFTLVIAMSSSRDAWSVRWDLKRQSFRLTLPRVKASEKTSLWPRGPLDDLGSQPLDLINGCDHVRRVVW
ncbi:hypothetical protein A2U01_0058979, partial [Trifolium medium]|nr:hypothetical protein [Trifolium medium]